MKKLITPAFRFTSLIIVCAIFYVLAKSIISYISPSSAWMPSRLEIKKNESSLTRIKKFLNLRLILLIENQL